MDNIPAEVIYRHAFQKTAEYFAGKIEQRRKDGYVAVLVEDYYESLFFMECDRDGYPKSRQYKSLELPRLEAFLTVGEIPVSTQIQCYEIEIIIEKPLIASNYYWQPHPVIFMWSGRKMGRQQIPVERLNVQELMRVAQTAIKNREGLIVDEALKNKIYK